MTRLVPAALIVGAWLWAASPAAAQSSSNPPPTPRPWGRVSFFSSSAKTTLSDGTSSTFSELSTAVSYQLPDRDMTRVEYGLDMRHATYPSAARVDRVSIYEAFVGARLADGAFRFKVGHLSLTDVGTLGSVAGGLIEVASRREAPDAARLRVGVFGGYEPNLLETGYAPHVRKFGGYVTYDGVGARRHSLGLVTVRNSSLTERTAVTTSTFLPVGQKLFVYQSAEYDPQAPAGRGPQGLSQLFAMARVLPADRVDLQATYTRNRAIDVRGLSEDVLAGRPIQSFAIDGLLFDSVGGRVTVEVVRRVRIYGGYARDRYSSDAQPSGRTMVGGYASNVLDSGLDVTVSDSLISRPAGTYHSQYVSLGHQLGRTTYLSADFSTSLSIVQFSRSDGVTIEMRPHTNRFSTTASINLERHWSLLITAERSTSDGIPEFRVLSGLTYRIR